MRNISRALLLMTLLVLTGCQGGSDSGVGSETAPADLPLLAQGQYVSIFRGFNPTHPAETIASMEQRWQESIGQGMGMARIQLGWRELEASS